MNLEREIQALAPWFHNLRLAGIETAPDHFLGDYPSTKFAHFSDLIPADLHGATVLDIGCNAGFYAFEMKRRGASRVVAIDSDARYLAQAALASRVLELPIDLHCLDVYNVGEIGERFDLVLFMGVLYHLRHPLLALDRIYDHVVGDRLLFQSMVRGAPDIPPVEHDYPFAEEEVFERPGFPAMYFVEHCFAGDWTNWWIPNRACVEAMLRSAGFAIERHVDDVYLCRRQAVRSHESDAEVAP